MYGPGQPDVIDLRDYLAVARQQWRVIVAVTALVVIAALVATLVRTPQYSAETELVVERVRATQDTSLSELLNPIGTVDDTVVAAAASVAVAERAAAMLGRTDPEALREQMTITVVRDTLRLRFAATSSDPDEAARIANTYVSAFVEHRRDEALASIARLQGELDGRAEELRADIAEVDAQLAQLVPDDPVVPDDPDADDESAAPPAPDPEVETLQIRRAAVQSQLSQVILRRSELDISEDSLAGLSAEFTPATAPSRPVGGGLERTLVLAFVLGLMLGVGAAFLRDHFHDALRSEDDLRRATGGLPVLGRIPTWRPKEGDPERRLVSMAEPSSHPAEAYRELSAGVRFLLVARSEEVGDGTDTHHGLGSSRSILVTSANMGEGKTATAANLAVAVARVGFKTILVDADLRRSAVGRRFGLPQMLGLSDALLNGDPPDEYLVDVGVPQLRLLTAGATPPNPTELLASPAMRAMHSRLLAMADLVIYDTPAVLAVADTLEIGPHVDLGIIVGRIGSTTRRRVQAAMQRLGQVGTDISGGVVNGVEHQSQGYYYEDYYGPYEAEGVERDPVPQSGKLTPRVASRATRDDEDDRLFGRD